MNDNANRAVSAFIKIIYLCAQEKVDDSQLIFLWHEHLHAASQAFHVTECLELTP